MSRAMDGWTTPHTGVELLGQMSRQIDLQDRRTRIPNASQILGPGLGPRATLLTDWNAEETTFNGIFYSEAGSLNSPDSADGWIGTSFTTPDGRGVQEVTPIGEASPLYRRIFASSGSGTRTFGVWVGPGGPGGLPGGVTINTTGAWATGVPGPTSGVPFTCRGGVLRGMASAQGYAPEATVLQVVVYIDGSPAADLVLGTLHPDGYFVTLGPAAFEVNVTPGEHYAYWRQLSGLSTSAARGALTGTVSDT